MRKKILSVLLALCTVLTLLPPTVFAAELTEAQIAALKAQGYTDEETANVLVVSEDTVIDAAGVTAEINADVEVALRPIRTLLTALMRVPSGPIRST